MVNTVDTNQVTAEVVVIGAGLAGLICAQRLQQAGLRVILVEKSRGLGGRMATRRLPNGHADHGVRYLEVQGSLTQQLIDRLSDHQVLRPWLDTVHVFDRTGLHPDKPQARYASPTGITAVAKALGTGLEIWRGQRVQALNATAERWEVNLEPLEGDEGSPRLVSKALVLMIPAPQALALLEPLLPLGLVPELVQQVRSVQFAPCITAIAAYSMAQQPIALDSPWQAVRFLDHPELDWVAIDSSKQPDALCPAVIVQSTAQFANADLEAADLQPVGQDLLSRASDTLAPWLATPDVLQVHRWRYAFVSQPLSVDCIASQSPLPIVCGGDWCDGGWGKDGPEKAETRNDRTRKKPSGIEVALRSGLAAAEQIKDFLQPPSLANGEADAMLAETTLPIEAGWDRETLAEKIFAETIEELG